MSADDFQTKYSSVMEAMLKSAVAETTKLFETMVDELKEEICRMKKENDDLKSRCSHFEKARHQSAVCSGETERLRGPSDGPRKRDRAVQCDLVPVHTALVEPCQPQMHPPVQKRNQQCVYDPKVSSLHDHTYGEANTRRASLFFKQEAIRKQQTARCTRRLDLNENAGFTQASVCRTRSKGPLIYQNYSTCKRIFPKKIQDARITLERPCRRRESYLQGAQNQSIELQHSLTGSVKDNLQEAASQISEEQQEILTPEKHTLGVAQHQSEVEPQRPVRSLRRQRIETSVIKQADVTQQQNTDVQSTEQAEPTPLGNGEECEKIKSGVAEHEACPGLVVPAQCKRGRQRKKTKPIGSSAAALLASLSERCSSEKQKLQDSQRLSKEMEGVPVQAPSPKRSSAILTPNTQTVQPRERRTSATLQDALLFVEAMNQSTVEETVSTPQRVAASCVVTLETVEEVPPEQQTPPPSVEMVEDTGNLPIAELSATTQSSIETVDDTSLTAEATPVGKTKPQINVVPKGLCTVTPSSTTTSSEPIATAEVQTLSIQQIHPLPTSAKATSPEIFSATRLLSSLRHIIGTRSPTQLPNAVSTVAAAQKQSIPPNSTTSPSSLPSVPQKMMYVMSSDLPPSVAPQSTATSSDTQSETPLRPQLTIIVPKGMSIIAPSEIVPDTMQQTVDSAKPVTVSSPQLNSSTEESSVSLDTQTVSDETAAISPQKKDPMTDNLESPKQTAAVEPNEQKSEACSSFDMPLVPTSVAPMVPQTTDQKLSPVVRLMRLPAQVLAQEEILVSTLFKIYSSQSQPIVLKDTTQENPSPTVESTQSSETTVLSTDSCPESKETLVDLDVYTFQMSEEPNEEEETSSISLNLEASPLREPSPSEPTSNFYEDISFEMQDCASQNDQPIEETPSTSLIQLTPIITKDDPHLQMTKAQFLAQLSVTPVSQDPQEASSNDSADVSASCAEQSTGKKRMPKKSRVAHLRSNLKTRLQARRKEGNPEPETSTENPEEHSLENDGPNNNTLTTGPTFPSLNDPEEVEDVTSQNNTSKDADPVSPRKSGQREAVARPKKTVSEPTSVSSKILKVRGKSSPMGTRLGADGVVVKTKRSISASPRRSAVKESPKNTRSSSVSPRSPRRSIAIKESLITKKIKSTSVTPRRSIVIKESPITKKTKSTSVSPRRSIAIKESLSIQKPKSTTVSPRRSVANKESPSIKKKKSTSVSPRRSIAIKESLSIEKTKSTSVSPRRSIASKESPSIKRTKSTSVSPRRSIAIKENPRTRKARSTSVSPRRSIAIKESPSTKKAKFSAVTPRRSPSTKQNASSKKTKSISVGPRKNISTGDGAPPKNPKHTSLSPKTTSSGVDAISKTTKSSPRTPSVQKKSTIPNVLTNESTFCRRRCTLNKTVSYSYQNQRESSSLADGASSKNIKNGSVSPNVKCRKTRETPPAKKPRLYQDGTGLKQTSTAVDAKNLDKVAKANATPKTTRSSQSKLVFGAKIVQLAENHTVCENGRKITAKSVWTPPKMPPGKTPLTGRKEAVSPKSQEQPSVFPPSVSLTPIPVKGPPVVSPLQPLSVIGRRLLKNQCGECGRVLSSVAALESHVSLHAGRRPFSCTLCGKRFPDSKGLKRHGRVHRNGRIHVCQHCGKGFVYRFGLTKHLQMVHRKIKPFICQICNKGFFTKRDVEAHIRIHTGEKPFHCNLCEKKFARRVELNVHLRWHNGEKRHWCPFCGKGFLDFNNLKRHKFIHTGEKPHSCPHCPKNFTQSGHLKKHVKNVHKIL